MEGKKTVQRTWTTFELTRAVSLAAPPVRMVVLEAAFDPDTGESWCHVQPVVAIETRLVRRYTRVGLPGDHPRSLSPTTMRQDGWQFVGEDVQHQPIVCDDTGDGLMSMDDLRGGHGVVVRLCACPWPATEDGARLADQVAKVTELARQMACPGRPADPVTVEAAPDAS